MSQAANLSQSAKASKGHPPTTAKQHAARPQLQLWLFSICALIFLIVFVGGATRLTGSGLSITEWKPILGAIPPLSLADWQEAFEKYKLIPQYKEINAGMSLEDFKTIFWWEWVHRFLGRIIGIAFLVPYLFFLLTNRVEQSLKPKLWGLFVLGGLQGFLGWYMVASGLVERTDVSQYRLALHLGLAIFIFAATFWIALGLGKKQNQTTDQTKPTAKSLKWSANAIAGLIFLQIIAGAFVAGLKAGKAYNTWPLMNGHFIPDGLSIMQPLWRNFFENALTVQFNHRIIAYIIIAAILVHMVQCAKSSANHHLKSAVILVFATLAQIVVGIATLILSVPLDLALIHQTGALIILGIALWHRRQMV